MLHQKRASQISHYSSLSMFEISIIEFHLAMGDKNYAVIQLIDVFVSERSRQILD
jgi:hypothetical protein